MLVGYSAHCLAKSTKYEKLFSYFGFGLLTNSCTTSFVWEVLSSIITYHIAKKLSTTQKDLDCVCVGKRATNLCFQITSSHHKWLYICKYLTTLRIEMITKTALDCESECFFIQKRNSNREQKCSYYISVVCLIG